jgi:hypothetical protein
MNGGPGHLDPGPACHSQNEGETMNMDHPEARRLALAIEEIVIELRALRYLMARIAQDHDPKK